MAIEDQTLPPIAPQPAPVLKPQAAGVIQDDMLERAEEARRADRPQYELDSAIELFAPMRDFKREEKPLSPTYMKAMKLIGVDLGQPVKAPNIRESDFARKRLMRGGSPRGRIVAPPRPTPKPANPRDTAIDSLVSVARAMGVPIIEPKAKEEYRAKEDKNTLDAERAIDRFPGFDYRFALSPELERLAVPDRLDAVAIRAEEAIKEVAKIGSEPLARLAQEVFRTDWFGPDRFMGLTRDERRIIDDVIHETDMKNAEAFEAYSDEVNKLADEAGADITSLASNIAANAGDLATFFLELGLSISGFNLPEGIDEEGLTPREKSDLIRQQAGSVLGQAGPGVRGFFIKLLSDPGDTLLAKPVDVVLTAVPVVSAIGKSGSAVANSQRFKNAKANIDRKVDEIRVGMANSPSPAVKRSGELMETALSASKNKYASFKAYFDDPATVATPEGTELVKAGTSVADESRKAVEGEFNIMAEQLGDAIRGGDGSMSPPRPTRFRNVDDTPPPDPATESSVNFVMPPSGPIPDSPAVIRPAARVRVPDDLDPGTRLEGPSDLGGLPSPPPPLPPPPEAIPLGGPVRRELPTVRRDPVGQAIGEQARAGLGADEAAVTRPRPDRDTGDVTQFMEQPSPPKKELPALPRQTGAVRAQAILDESGIDAAMFQAEAAAADAITQSAQRVAQSQLDDAGRVAEAKAALDEFLQPEVTVTPKRPDVDFVLPADDTRAVSPGEVRSAVQQQLDEQAARRINSVDEALESPIVSPPPPIPRLRPPNPDEIAAQRAREVQGFVDDIVEPPDTLALPAPATPLPSGRYGQTFKESTVTVEPSGRVKMPERTTEVTVEPQRVNVPDEIVTRIKEVDEIFGSEGVIAQGLMTADDVLDQVQSILDYRTASFMLSPRGREAVLNAQVANAKKAGMSGRELKRFKKEFKRTLEEAADRAASSGFDASVSVPNALFPDGSVGNTRNIAINIMGKNKDVRAAIAQDNLSYVGARIARQAQHRASVQAFGQQVAQQSPLYKQLLRAEKGTPEHAAIMERIRNGEGFFAVDEAGKSVPLFLEELKALNDMAYDGYLPNIVLTGAKGMLSVADDLPTTLHPRLRQRLKEMQRPDADTAGAMGLSQAPDTELVTGFRKVRIPGVLHDRVAARTFEVWGPISQSYKQMVAIPKRIREEFGSVSLSSMAREAIELFRLGRVVGNPASHASALVGNTLLQLIRRGEYVVPRLIETFANLSRVKRGLKTVGVAKGAKRIAEQDDIYKAAIRSGYLDSSFIALTERFTPAALGESIRGFSALFRQLAQGGPLAKFYGNIDNIFKVEEVVNNGFPRIKAELDTLKVGEVYDLRTGLNRTLRVKKTRRGFENEKNGKALTKNQMDTLIAKTAFQRTNNAFVNYSEIPRLLVVGQNNPYLSPFLTPFAAWSISTATNPLAGKGGLAVEALRGARPRGYTNSAAVNAKRVAEDTIHSTFLATAGALASETLDFDHEERERIAGGNFFPGTMASIRRTGDDRIAEVVDYSNANPFSSLIQLTNILSGVGAIHAASVQRGNKAVVTDEYGNEVYRHDYTEDALREMERGNARQRQEAKLVRAIDRIALKARNPRGQTLKEVLDYFFVGGHGLASTVGRETKKRQDAEDSVLDKFEGLVKSAIIPGYINAGLKMIDANRLETIQQELSNGDVTGQRREDLRKELLDLKSSLFRKSDARPEMNLDKKYSVEGQTRNFIRYFFRGPHFVAIISEQDELGAKKAKINRSLSKAQAAYTSALSQEKREIEKQRKKDGSLDEDDAVRLDEINNTIKTIKLVFEEEGIRLLERNAERQQRQ